MADRGAQLVLSKRDTVTYDPWAGQESTAVGVSHMARSLSLWYSVSKVFEMVKRGRIALVFFLEDFNTFQVWLIKERH